MYSVPSRHAPRTRIVPPHDTLRDTPAPAEASREAFQVQGAEFIIFVTPGVLRIVNPAITEKQARANVNLEHAVAPQLRDLRRAVTRLGAGR